MKLYLSFVSDLYTDEVPDPYYGGVDGFREVIELCETASDEFLRYLIKNGHIPPVETLK